MVEASNYSAAFGAQDVVLVFIYLRFSTFHDAVPLRLEEY
jgi:hypothetical protein